MMKLIQSFFILCVTYIALVGHVMAVNITWTNGNGTGIWSDPLNWSTGAVPGGADAAIFDATSVANCSIDISSTIQSINISAAYTGSVSLGANTLSISSGFTVATASGFGGGTGLVILTANQTINSAASVFDLEINMTAVHFDIVLSQDLNVDNMLTITSVDQINSNKINVGGDIVSNDVTVGGTAFISAVGSTNQTLSGTGHIANLDVSKSGGNLQLPGNFTLNNNAGAAQLTGSDLIENTGGQLVLIDVSTLNFSGSVDDVEINMIAAFFDLTLSQDFNVNNTLTITSVDQINSNKINVGGDIVSNDVTVGGTAFISAVGSTNQTLSGTGHIANLDVSKSGGNLQLPGNFTLNNNAGAAQLTGSGLIKNTGGQLVLIDVSTLNFSGLVDDVEINMIAAFFDLTLTQDFNVNNTLTITSVDQINNNKINVGGDIVSDDAAIAGTSFISLSGNSDQSITGAGELDRLDFSKPAGDVLMATFNLNFILVTVSSGQWDVLGNVVTATGGFTAQGGQITGEGTLIGNVFVNTGSGIAPGNSPGCLTINGNATFNSGSDFDVDIAGDNACTDHDQLTVNGTLIINDASLTGTTTSAPTTTITIIDNGGGGPVNGSKFSGAAEGATVNIGGTNYVISYIGGTGNDVIIEPACSDGDGDGFIDLACGGTDCVDTNNTVYPGAPEIVDGLDNDCDGFVDENLLTISGSSCTPVNATYALHPTLVCNGKGWWATNAPGGISNGSIRAIHWTGDRWTIGFIQSACDTSPCEWENFADTPNPPSTGWVSTCGSCGGNLVVQGDTSDPPACPDSDGDGFTDASCGGTDCNDSDDTVFPGAVEICDGIDNNCDGSADEGFDLDGDGFTTCAGDCDDGDSSIFPGAVEICDGIDNNCDGNEDEGFDLDGDGFTTCAGDCDDGDSSIFPSAVEICDGIDNNCDGSVDEGFDLDGDGFTTCAGDCDDSDPNTYPGAPELCDGGDNDCDGVVPSDEIDDDGDGQTECQGDCDDADPNNYTGNTEVCDGQDNNCDGLVDEGFTDTDSDGIADCIDEDDDNDGCLDIDDLNPLDFSKDSDCDGVADDCDVCPGGDDTVDANGDDIADCSQILDYNAYSADWKCKTNKILICHNSNNPQTLCISKNALGTHVKNHGDVVGPCISCQNSVKTPPSQKSKVRTIYDLEIRPNPASDLFYLDITGIDRVLDLMIVNSIGQVIWRAGKTELEGQLISIQSSNLEAGIYFVNLSTNHTTITKTLIIVK